MHCTVESSEYTCWLIEALRFITIIWFYLAVWIRLINIFTNSSSGFNVIIQFQKNVKYLLVAIGLKRYLWFNFSYFYYYLWIIHYGTHHICSAYILSFSYKATACYTILCYYQQVTDGRT